MDISAIITAHHEGVMAGVSLRSLLSATAMARDEGLEVEVIIMLDNPDPTTASVFSDAEIHGWRLETVAYGDQGKVRNQAVKLSRGEYIAFLDGDDLWSENWLTAAHAVCASDPGRIICHPEVDWFFGSNNNRFFHADQTDPRFEPAFLRFGNYWDALCMAPREAYLRHPFSDREIAKGYAYEDWHWNCETFTSGMVHRIAEETIHFKRRREGSQTMEASSNKSVPRRTNLFDYAWIAEHLGA